MGKKKIINSEIEIKKIQEALTEITDLQKQKDYIIQYSKDNNDIFLEALKTDERAYRHFFSTPSPKKITKEMRQNAIKKMTDEMKAKYEQSCFYYYSDSHAEYTFSAFPMDKEKEEIKVLKYLRKIIFKINKQLDFKKGRTTKQIEETIKSDNRIINLFKQRIIEYDKQELKRNEKFELYKQIINEIDNEYSGGFESLKLLAEMKTDFSEKENIENRIVELYLEAIKSLKGYTPDSEVNADEQQDKKTLAEKINWIKEPELLRTHLEKLKENKFIQYVNPELVMSGDEIARIDKPHPYNSGNRNILYIFFLWWEQGLIHKSFITEIKENNDKIEFEIQAKTFIEKTFKQINGKDLKGGDISKEALEERKGFYRKDKKLTPKETDLYTTLKQIMT